MTLTTLSGEPVRRAAFGCMQFGGTADAAASQAMFEASRAAGIRHFDTAQVYTNGESERLLGQFIAGQRDALYVATKVGSIDGAGRDNIRQSFDACRARLDCDMVDLLYMHRWDPDTPLTETIETLAALQSEGKIRQIGVSNYAAWQVMKAQAVAAEFGTRIDVVQPMYNLVKRQAEVEILPMCASEGILAVPYSPLGGGLLTGKYGGNPGQDSHGANAKGRLHTNALYAARYALPVMHQTARDLADLAEEIGTDSATLAVAWAMMHPARPAPILSARSEAQLRPSLAALTYPMDQGLYDRISALSPAPPPATDRLEEA